MGMRNLETGKVVGSFSKSISKQLHHPVPSLYSSIYKNKYSQFSSLAFTIKAAASSSSSSKPKSRSKNEWTPSLITRKAPNTKRRLITIATSDAKWNGTWTCDYILSLEDLQLAYLTKEIEKDTKVLINLTMEKHASFGFSVEGRIFTSWNTTCGSCASLYCRKIHTTFNVWILNSRREKHSNQLPDIGGDDPSVIYVKPGCEADLDALVRDSIRLVTSVKETCSESCEKSEQTWQFSEGSKSSVDGRWSRLLELRKSM